VPFTIKEDLDLVGTPTTLGANALALDEIPGVLRHVRIFLLVASIAMMVFATGLLVVLWKAVS
jgi:hypothetical protein